MLEHVVLMSTCISSGPFHKRNISRHFFVPLVRLLSGFKLLEARPLPALVIRFAVFVVSISMMATAAALIAALLTFAFVLCTSLVILLWKDHSLGGSCYDRDLSLELCGLCLRHPLRKRPEAHRRHVPHSRRGEYHALN